MKKSLLEILNAFKKPYTLTAFDGKSPLKDFLQEDLSKCIVKNLVFDSRAVTKGALFFALPGTHTTGNAFIKDAIQNGAAAVVFEGEFSLKESEEIRKALEERTLSTPVFLVKVDSARFAMSPMSAFFFDNPSEKLIVYGVTGTEGKSSTVSFLWQFLRQAGIKAGFISTVQYSLGEDALPNPEHQTTPEAPIVQERLYQMLQNGCTRAVIEASSHGLSKKLNRLGDVHFDVGIFLNVTLEHLEFHGTLEQYRFDKANLFRALDTFSHKKCVGKEENAPKALSTVPSFGIVNAEDEACSYFASCTKKDVFGIATDTGKNAGALEPYFYAERICDQETLSFSLYSPREAKRYKIETSVKGAFNAYNITAALLALYKAEKIPLETLVQFPKKLVPVKGRMTAIQAGQDFELIVDYAHTPSSFKAIFPPLKARCTGKIICVFGSGGERDRTKRPLQGEIAAQFSSIIILTDEDPRKEDRLAILKEIAGSKERGALKMGKVLEKDLFLIPDRPVAIRKALSFARKGDIVLLLGKSHENSIIYSDFVMPYDEIAEAKKALLELGFSA